jgi:ADP-heptose:LPS heptosyltransferase
LHIAVGLGRKIVTIFGPTDPKLVGPYHRDECVVRPADADEVLRTVKYRRLRDDQSLISEVSVDDVWERVQQVMRAPEAMGITV